jgi:phage terminase large subunit GpA-like protein
VFARAADVLMEVAELLRPPRRISPSEAAAKYLANERGAWSRALTPMWTEPLDLLASREYRGIVVAGPARTGKTFALVDGALAYIVTCAPADMLVVQMSQDAARDFSRTEVDRVIRHSPELSARLSPRLSRDNLHDKLFRAGNMLKIAWPVITQLASRTFQTVILTDFDRPENRDNVDGEGPLWDLALKRVETHMSRGKCLAESSPGEDIISPDWRPTMPHEAPPARGILALYNRGTRARWFWKCLHCGEPFQAEPGIAPFGLPAFDELAKLVLQQDLNELATQYAKVVCKACGGLHLQADRVELNRTGVWVHEGQRILDGVITGGRRRTPIASYWLGGVAAVYQTWHSMVYRYLGAVQTFAKIGDESQLRSVTYQDLGAPYLSRALVKRRTGAQLIARAESWTQGTVPAGVRFLTGAVDVSAHKFVVQVQGWGVDLETWLIDRFSISASKRPEGARFAALAPAGYAEDWQVLREQLIGRTYPLERDPTKFMPIMLILCDSGGKEGVTERAYDFWRGLRREFAGRRMQFLLVKGTGKKDAPRVERTFPDSTGRRDRPGGGRGDVPVWLLGTDALKDSVANDLLRDEPGPGYFHLPDWLEPAVFDELTAEVRTAKGWTRPGGVPNESFDLSVYNRGATILLNAERINWSKPPRWAVSPDAAPVDAPSTPSSSQPPSPPPRRGPDPRWARGSSSGWSGSSSQNWITGWRK